jgi:hypothetical protein
MVDGFVGSTAIGPLYEVKYDHWFIPAKAGYAAHNESIYAAMAITPTKDCSFPSASRLKDSTIIIPSLQTKGSFMQKKTDTHRYDFEISLGSHKPPTKANRYGTAGLNKRYAGNTGRYSQLPSEGKAKDHPEFICMSSNSLSSEKPDSDAT